MFLRFLAAAAILVSWTPALAQSTWEEVEIQTVELGGGVYMLQGVGGNIGLSVGADGALLIDNQHAPLTDKIKAAVAALTDRPVKYVINSHWHGDHTGGNENFGKAGAIIVAHDNLRERLKTGFTRTFPFQSNNPPAPAAALPAITFTDSATFHFNGDEIHVLHPPRAHTDGDAIIFFRSANVVHMGDLFFRDMFPFIDLDTGGTIDGYIAAQEIALSQSDAETKIIPGHGALANRADLERAVAMLKTVRDRVAALIDAGRTEDQAVAEIDLSDYEEWGRAFISAEVITRLVYRGLAAG